MGDTLMANMHLGRDFTPPDIHAKVTGRAKYAEDFRAEGMVFCRLLLSTAPHARVTKIDASEALKMEGVLGILTADDLPETKGPGEPILTKEPMFVGDRILAVAATSEALAQEAIDKIKVEMEPLPFVIDPLDSLYPGGKDARIDGNVISMQQVKSIKWTAADFASAGDSLPTGAPAEEWSFGDVEAGFKAAKVVLDESFVTAALSHHCLEPRSAMAYWENGKCFVYGSLQSQTAGVPALARMAGIEPDNLVFVAEFCGGGFGSKINPYPAMGVPIYMAKKLNRPVMMRVSRAEEGLFGSSRPAFQGRIKIGFAANGRVTAVDFCVVQQNGPYSGGGDYGAAAGAITLLYQPPAMRYRGVAVSTNTTPTGAQRGPGQNQIAGAIEPLLDKAAKVLGVDRVQLRRINAADNKAKYDGTQGPVTSAYQREAIERGAAAFNWDQRKARSGQGRGAKVTGVGVGQAFHSAGRSGYDGLVRITPD